MRVSYIGNTPAFQAGKVGSIPTTRSIYALLAQLVEHLTLNQGVQGSNPWRRTESTVFADKAIAAGTVFFCACKASKIKAFGDFNPFDYKL